MTDGNFSTLLDTIRTEIWNPGPDLIIAVIHMGNFWDLKIVLGPKRGYGQKSFGTQKIYVNKEPLGPEKPLRSYEMLGPKKR